MRLCANAHIVYISAKNSQIDDEMHIVASKRLGAFIDSFCLNAAADNALLVINHS